MIDSSVDRQLISIILPVFNEESNVERTYKAIKYETDKLSDYKFELLITDNCSTDRTFEKLVRIASNDPDVRIVRFARNFGFQKSVLTGYRLARGVAAIQIDADLQDPPSLFAAFLAKWEEGYDVVVGVRRYRKEGYLLRQSRRLFYRFLSRMDGPHLIPDAGDFRLLDQSILHRLKRIHDHHLYLRGLISSLAKRQFGIPYDRSEREHDESKFKLGSLFKLAVDGVLAHTSAPLLVSFYSGILIAFVAALLAVFYGFVRLIDSDIPSGFTTTQILILFGIGINSIFLGVLGVYVGRTYDQVRLRPPTVISDLVNFDRKIDAVEMDLENENINAVKTN